MQIEIIYKELPKHVLCIYTQICNKPYGIINSYNSHDDKVLMEEVCRYFYTINCENIILTSDFLSNEEQQERFKKLVKDKKVLELAEKKIKKIKDEQSTCLTCMAY